jgi:hypothetical protein
LKKLKLDQKGRQNTGGGVLQAVHYNNKTGVRNKYVCAQSNYINSSVYIQHSA